MDHCRRVFKFFAVAGLLIAVSVAMAACGGSSDSTSTSAASAGEGEESSGGSSAKVDAILSEATAPAKWEGPTEPDPAAANKHIALIMTFAAAEGEQLLQEGAETATAALGWKSTYIDGKGTPQGYEAGISQAITEGVDGVVFGAITPSLVPNGMKKLKAAGIPVVIQSNIEEPTEELWLANIGYNTKKEAEFLAAQLTKESEGKAKLMIVEDSEFGIVSQRAEYFKPLLEELCSECEIVNETDMQVTELETKLGPKVGGVLQANPSVDYVYAPYDASVPPMVAAIKQAGLADTVKVVSYGGFQQSTEYLRKKEIQTATVANATQWQAWEAYDVLNRAFNGQKIPKNALATDPIKLLTWDNPPPAGQYYEGNEADYKGHYEELWAGK